jgi:hypothetical protein
MAWPKGKPTGRKPSGRPKGIPNKVTGDLREMIKGALTQAGGQGYLVDQARNNPTAFLTLLGKVVPQEVKSEIDGILKVIHESK